MALVTTGKPHKKQVNKTTMEYSNTKEPPVKPFDFFGSDEEIDKETKRLAEYLTLDSVNVFNTDDYRFAKDVPIVLRNIEMKPMKPKFNNITGDNGEKKPILDPYKFEPKVWGDLPSCLFEAFKATKNDLQKRLKIEKPNSHKKIAVLWNHIRICQHPTCQTFQIPLNVLDPSVHDRQHILNSFCKIMLVDEDHIKYPKVPQGHNDFWDAFTLNFLNNHQSGSWMSLINTSSLFLKEWTVVLKGVNAHSFGVTFEAIATKQIGWFATMSAEQSTEAERDLQLKAMEKFKKNHPKINLPIMDSSKIVGTQKAYTTYANHATIGAGARFAALEYEGGAIIEEELSSDNDEGVSQALVEVPVRKRSREVHAVQPHKHAKVPRHIVTNLK